MNEELHDTPGDDVALRALLLNHAPRPPLDAVDWAGLHARIRLEAAPLLRRGPAWLHQLATWSPRVTPYATALATALVVLLLNTAPPAPDPSTAAAEPVAFRTIEEEFETADAVLLATIDEDALLEAALFNEDPSDE